jgi:hypothetical protein
MKYTIDDLHIGDQVYFQWYGIENNDHFWTVERKVDKFTVVVSLDKHQTAFIPIDAVKQVIRPVV